MEPSARLSRYHVETTTLIIFRNFNWQNSCSELIRRNLKRNSKTSWKTQYPCSTDRFLLQNRETFLIKWLLDSRALVDVCILRRRETCGWPLKRPTHENSSNWALRRRRTGLCSCHHKLHPSSPTVIANDFHPEGWSTRGETSLNITCIHDTEKKWRKKKSLCLRRR